MLTKFSPARLLLLLARSHRFRGLAVFLGVTEDGRAAQRDYGDVAAEPPQHLQASRDLRISH